MIQNGIIDVHAHLTTPEYIETLRKHNALTEDGFPIPSWSSEEHLACMERLGISWSLLSMSSPSPFFKGHEEEGILACRQLNDAAAKAQRDYPDRFGFTATLPLPDVGAAMAEAARAMDELGAKGIKFGSNSRGLYLGDPALEPLMKELDKRGAVCNIHPQRPYPLNETVFSAGPVPLFEFLADTTRAVLNLMAHGVVEHYPNIKWVVPHNGSFLPNISDRFASIFEVLGKGRNALPAVDVEANFRRLYFDTAGHPAPHLLDFLLTVASPDHILYGSDYPFPPVSFIEGGLHDFENLLDTRTDLKPFKEKILSENARELFKLRD